MLKALWAIKCNANSFQNVALFVSKVRLAFQHLCVGDIYDEEYAYDWLWQNLKDFAGIKNFVDKIISARDDPQKAYRRTWNYLWGATNEVLSHKNIDANDENYVKSFIADISPGGIDGMSADLQDPSKRPWDKGKGKGRGDKSKSNPKGGSGKGERFERRFPAFANNW